MSSFTYPAPLKQSPRQELSHVSELLFPTNSEFPMSLACVFTRLALKGNDAAMIYATPFVAILADKSV